MSEILNVFKDLESKFYNDYAKDLTNNYIANYSEDRIAKSSKGHWLRCSNLTYEEILNQLCLDVRKICKKQLRVKRANEIRAIRDNKTI